MSNVQTLPLRELNPYVSLWPGGFDYYRELDKRTEERIAEKLIRYGQMFELTGGTKNIPNDRLKQLLLQTGFGLFKPMEGKLYFLLGNLGGEQDPTYRYKKFVWANPYLPTKQKDGSEDIYSGDVVLARCDTNMTGVLPILRRYSYLESHTELSMYLATVMSRLTQLGIAGRDAEAEAFDAVVKDIEAGNVKAIADRNILSQMRTQPYGGQTGILTDLIELTQYLKASEANELGLQANWNAKRETLTSSETLLNQDTLMTLAQNMFDNWTMWIDDVNEKFADMLEDGPYKLEWSGAWAVNEKESEAEDAKLEEEIKEPEEGGDENADTTLPNVDD